MLQTGTPNQLTLLAVLCVSFYIFTLARCAKSGEIRWVYGSYGFFIPLSLTASAILTARPNVSGLLINLTDPALALVLPWMIMVNQKSKWYHSLKYLPYLFSVSILAFAWLIPANTYDTITANISSGILLVSAAILLFLISKYLGMNTALFGAVFCFTGEGIFRLFQDSNMDKYIFILKFAAYIFFSVFFTAKILEDLKNRLREAEMELNRIHRSLEPEIKKRTLEIEQVNQSLVKAARMDSLSKALNKAAILDEMEKLIHSRIREFSILMFDIDDFKLINDTLGHMEGDKCIHRLSLETRYCLNNFDSLGRYGGDEFIALLPGSTPGQAANTAEHIRKRIDSIKSPHFTISIGIASYPCDAQNVEDLIAFADKGLYASKSKGKNTISTGCN